MAKVKVRLLIEHEDEDPRIRIVEFECADPSLEDDEGLLHVKSGGGVVYVVNKAHLLDMKIDE